MILRSKKSTHSLSHERSFDKAKVEKINAWGEVSGLT